MKKYPCYCCGYLTRDQEEPGTYNICPVCFWEDDPIQPDYPDTLFGANGTTLAQARKNFEAFGACKEESRRFVRKPYLDEIPEGRK